MTKQPHSATRLRLSRLFRWLAVLCFIKLSILGMLMLDVPLPSWLGGAPEERMSAQRSALAPAAPENPASGAQTQISAPAGQAAAGISTTRQNFDENNPGTDFSENLPQGSAAAQLAATARPRRHGGPDAAHAALPAPLVSTATPSASTEPVFTMPPSLPEPAQLAAPATEAGTMSAAGTPLSVAGPLLAADVKQRERVDGWLDMLGLKHLPIPGLGSVQAAHAAALDMPVPQTPATSSSPFAPAEQNAPLTMPGAPDIPANIPRGQGNDGAPLPPRGASGFGAALPALPESGQAAPLTAPAPTVRSESLPGDPNTKAQELARQQQDMLMLRQQMDQRLKELQDAEQKMKDMIREAKGLEDKKIRNLIQMYANMKPRTAAKALESMDERVAIRILSGMAPKQSGEILTYTNPAKTAKLTEMITRMRLPQ